MNERQPGSRMSGASASFVDHSATAAKKTRARTG